MSASIEPATREDERACPLDMNRRLLMGFLDHLRTEAAFGPVEGCFDLNRLRDLAEDYLNDARHPGPGAPLECLKLHDAVLWEDRRHRPFERLLARRFSHLLPKRVGDEGGPAPHAPLSRRLIPGLMSALSKMVGPALLDEAERRTETLLVRHREARLGLVDWAQLSAEVEADDVIIDVLMAAAHHFRDTDRRIDWLTQVINRHLPPPLPEDHDPAWRCDPARSRLLLKALYAPLAARLRDAVATEALICRFGDTAVADVRRMVEALET